MAHTETWIIGSSSDADTVVDGATVSGRHCRLSRSGDGYTIEDLGSTNGTYINGQRISSVHKVAPTDHVTLGLTVPLPWPDAPRKAAKRTIRIGRAPDNDVVLDHANVSGHHAWITIDGDRITLEDVGSTNGTAVGSPENKIKTAVVKRNDIIYFGSTAFPVAELLVATAAESASFISRPPKTPIIWAAAALGGAVIISAIAALAAVAVTAIMLRSEQERRAEGPLTEPVAPQVGEVLRREDQEPEQTPAAPAASEPPAPAVEPSTDQPDDAAPKIDPISPETAVPPPAEPTGSPLIPPVPAAPNVVNDEFWKLIQAGVFVIEVTNPSTKQSAPFGVAWAAREQQLITTAGQAAELRQFLKDGFRVVAVRQSDQGRVRVSSALPHAQLERRTQQPTDMFYDVGVLNIVSPTGLVLEMTTADELHTLSRNSPLICLGIPNSFDPNVSAQSFNVHIFRGKLGAVESLEPGGPSLLHLNLAAPDHLEGSPILTAEGKVAGTYSRPAPAAIREKAGFPLHAATSVVAVEELLRPKK